MLLAALQQLAVMAQGLSSQRSRVSVAERGHNSHYIPHSDMQSILYLKYQWLAFQSPSAFTFTQTHN